MTRRIVLHTDGGARGNPGPAGYGAVLTDAGTGERLASRSGWLGETTNNVAEYTAVVEGLRAAARIDPDAEVEVRADSKLVVEQMSGRWKIKHEDMRRLALEARDAFPAPRVRYTWIPRAQNSAADALANKAMDAREDADTDEWLTSRTPTAELGSESDEPATALFEISEPAPTDGTRAAPAAAPASATRPAGVDRSGGATRVYLVRHGVTEWTVGGRQSGSDTPGPDLLDLGRQQARRAGALLRALATDDDADLSSAEVRVSPMVRTRQTAQEVAAAAGLGEAVVDDRLREVEFGRWHGLTTAEIEDGWPGEWARWRADIDVTAPDGESHRQVGARVARVLKEVAGTERRTVVLVAHAVVVRAAVALVAGIEPRAWGRVRVRPGSVTMLGVSGIDPDGRFEGQINYVGAPSEGVG
ncbi:histidine phosphatase family protein [Georgenia sp. Z1491]|uniref:histidine phosphatase family protein n=1 Tax=Georgenia sp. Z1491 TaxID=3416707 RepID=UPI003CF6C4FB